TAGASGTSRPISSEAEMWSTDRPADPAAVPSEKWYLRFSIAAALPATHRPWTTATLRPRAAANCAFSQPRTAIAPLLPAPCLLGPVRGLRSIPTETAGADQVASRSPICPSQGSRGVLPARASPQGSRLLSETARYQRRKVRMEIAGRLGGRCGPSGQLRLLRGYLRGQRLVPL